MTVIRIKICRQTGSYGRVPHNRFWFVPSCGQSIEEYSGPHENLSTRRVEIGTKNPDFLPPPSCMLGPFDPHR